jgi:hypothetical protein
MGYMSLPSYFILKICFLKLEFICQARKGTDWYDKKDYISIETGGIWQS